MKAKSRKPISALLALALALGLLAAMPIAVGAESGDNRIDLDDSWFGSANTSTSAWEYDAPMNTFKVHGDVTVTGTVTGATKSLRLDIDSGVTVRWNADYSGSVNHLVELRGGGTFEVAQGGGTSQESDQFGKLTDARGFEATQDGAIKNSIGTTGFAINIEGTVKVVVSGGIVSGGGKAINANSAGPSVTVSGGTVESAGNYGAISANGKIEVSGGTVIASGDVATISSQDAITISGGTIKNTGTGIAVTSYGDNSSVTISGGVIESSTKGQTINATVLRMSGGEVRNTGENQAITIRGSGILDITGGTVCSTIHRAIQVSGVDTGPDDAKVDGGFVFAYGTAITPNVVHCESVGNSVKIGGTAVVCAWNQRAGRTAYTEGTSDDLTVGPSGATARWGMSDGQGGIDYKNGANTGFFPISGVTVTAAEPEPEPEPFTDVPANEWYHAPVAAARRMGLISGKSPTLFAPDDNLTYAEAVKLAACMHELHTTGEVTLAVGGGAWYQSYVDYAKQNGIIAKDYDWNAPASRAGYMEIFANALPESALAAVNSVADGAIPDVPMAHPQAWAIYRLYRAGIVQGVDAARNCNPGANIMRSEVAAILVRMMDPAERKPFSLP